MNTTRYSWLFGSVLVLSVISASTSYAQTTTVPGQDIGLAVGAPLPEGLYAINTFVYRRTDQRFSADTAVEVPVLIWSTPWKFLDARVEFLLSQDTVFAFSRNPAGVPNRDISVNVGSFVGGSLAWDLGSGVGVSYLFATYLNGVNGDRGSFVGAGGSTPVVPQLSSTAFRQDFAISYTADGWNLTAQLTHNFYDSPGRFGGPVGAALGPIFVSDALNLGLTATKKFGKFEIGAIGYGTTDLSFNPLSGTKNGRFALGGLIGYDFGSFQTQIYVARDVATRATFISAGGITRENLSTDGFFRLIVPLYTAAASNEQPVSLIRK